MSRVSLTLPLEEMLEKGGDESLEQGTMSSDCLRRDNELFGHDIQPLPTNDIELHFTMRRIVWALIAKKTKLNSLRHMKPFPHP